MRRRVLVSVALVAVTALVATGCGDDGDQAADDDRSTAPSTVTTVPAVPTETTAGPSEGAAACAELADRYVAEARRLFTVAGTPDDARVEAARARFAELDQIALSAVCGTAYTTAVCDGLDELANEGVLVLLPLTTARCL